MSCSFAPTHGNHRRQETEPSGVMNCGGRGDASRQRWARVKRGGGERALRATCDVRRAVRCATCWVLRAVLNARAVSLVRRFFAHVAPARRT